MLVMEVIMLVLTLKSVAMVAVLVRAPPTERPGGYGTILTRSAEAWKCFWHQNTIVNMPCHMHLYVSDP